MHLTFPISFIDALFMSKWRHWNFQSHLWELATGQEVKHGSYEVFPFTLGTRDILIMSMTTCCNFGYNQALDSIQLMCLFLQGEMYHVFPRKSVCSLAKQPQTTVWPTELPEVEMI